jgi:hypothetical protein
MQMREVNAVLSVCVLLVFFLTAYKVSLILREQKTTNELLRELLRK